MDDRKGLFMVKIGAYLKLFRLQNLLMIIICMYLVRHCIIIPFLAKSGIGPEMSRLDFFMLVLSTVLIAASGYSINDYFDLRIDRINRKSRITLGKQIPLRMAIILHSVFNLAGTILGFWVAYRIGFFRIGIAPFIVSILLFLYSMQLKRKFIIGNIVVSILSAFIVLIVWLFEFYALKQNGIGNLYYEKFLWGFIWVYTLFAFGVSLIREITKDLEDMEGDRVYSCRTLPIIIGEKNTQLVLFALGGVLSAFITYSSITLYFVEWHWLFAASLLPLALSLCYLVFLFFAKTKKHYSRLSLILKLLMLSGVLSLLFILPNL